MSIFEEDKLKECKLIFDMFDEDKDEQITIKDLADCLRICGATPSQQELKILQNYFYTKFRIIIITQINIISKNEKIVYLYY